MVQAVLERKGIERVGPIAVVRQDMHLSACANH